MRSDVPYGHPSFGKSVACQCRVKQRVTLFGGAHIPDDFHHRTFETYLKLPLAPEQRQVVTRVMRFMAQRVEAGYEGERRGLYLYGSWGIGKTGLAIAALCQAIEAGQSALYLSTSELFAPLYEAIAASQRLAHGYGDLEDKQEEVAGAKVLRLVETVTWLVLDDLGVECGSSFVVNRLYRIIEGRRSKKGLFTIFTSNKDAVGLEQRWRPAKSGAGAFDDCYRVIERLGEYCVVIPVMGCNLRQKERFRRTGLE
jgi:DNA replication protein DnaC